MRLPLRPALLFLSVLSVSATLAAMTLWFFSHARSPFAYMVAGTLAAAVALASVFVAVVNRKWL